MRIAPREQDKLFLHQVRSPSTRVVCVDVDRDIGRLSRTKKARQGSYPQSDGSDRSYCLCTSRAHQRWQTLRRRAYAAWKNPVRTKKRLSRCRIIGSRDPGRRDVPGWVRFVLLSLESVLISLCRVFLVTVHDPICTEFGNLGDALYGSFLPVPSNDLFTAHDPSASAQHALPGAVIVKNERIVINHGRERVRIKVTNNGDRPVQVSPRPHILASDVKSNAIDWITLPLHRNQPPSVLRSGQGLREATGHPGWYGSEVRTR